MSDAQRELAGCPDWCCLLCGREYNWGDEDNPAPDDCSDDCPRYHELAGKPAPED